MNVHTYNKNILADEVSKNFYKISDCSIRVHQVIRKSTYICKYFLVVSLLYYD